MPEDPHRSPLAEALDRVGDRWTLLLVEALLDGPRRFGDLQGELGGIAPNVLTHRLRHLEARGARRGPALLASARRASCTSSPPSGRELAGALRLLADWGARHREAGEPPRHAACGTPLEARWYCPTCERPVDEDDGGRPALRLTFKSSWRISPPGSSRAAGNRPNRRARAAGRRVGRDARQAGSPRRSTAAGDSSPPAPERSSFSS